MATTEALAAKTAAPNEERQRPSHRCARRWFGLGRFGFAIRRRGAARGEERRARQRAVEARPGLAVRERLLQAVEAAELAAEVVDHVDERGLARARHDRRAVLELAVVAQDDVQQGL